MDGRVIRRLVIGAAILAGLVLWHRRCPGCQQRWTGWVSRWNGR